MIFSFWFSIFIVIYAYFGYIVLLFILSLFKKPKDKTSDLTTEQTVTLLISAYNEENVIERKILNSLALNYPRDLLEIVILSDGSDDRTNQIISQYTDKGVTLRSYERRMGKTGCLNKAAPLSKGSILVFSDANSMYDQNAIKELAKNFADESIGFATGVTTYISKTGRDNFDAVDIYTRIEKATKGLETKFGSCVGADGAIFAIRKSLYQPLKDYDINDLVIPLNVIRQGYRGVQEAKAFCIEERSDGSSPEYNRQVRIANRTIRAIFNHGYMLNPFRFGMFSFELLSHKISKLLTPFFMVAIFLINLSIIKHGPIYGLTLSGQILFYVLAFWGYSEKYPKCLSKLVSIPYTFSLANIGILCGWIHYLRGKSYTIWDIAR
ncbi:MAG: glycosyltransferase family 2 protein [Candidatus Hodarchaeota archaeon]